MPSIQDLWLAFHPKSAPLDSEHTRELAAELMKRVDEKNGNNNGLVDFDEFLPWYTKIAEKHYKFVNAMPYIEAEVRHVVENADQAVFVLGFQRWFALQRHVPVSSRACLTSM